MALSVGKSNIQIGELGSQIQSDNYALSGYRIFKAKNLSTIEAMASLVKLSLNNVRIDEYDALTGSRDADQLFDIVTLRQEDLKK